MMRPSGLCPAKLMIIGEAPGHEEERLGQPFVGANGDLLNKMLHEAGIGRHECFATLVARERPPGNDFAWFMPVAKKDRREGMVDFRGRMVDPRIPGWVALLEKEIEMCQPETILVLGNAPLWVLTGKWGITKWRGSRLGGGDKPVIIPALPPAVILRQYELRPITVQDIRRAVQAKATDQPPVYNFLVRPDGATVLSTLASLLAKLEAVPTKLAVDIETRQGGTACIGIAWSATDAICIPFMCVERKEGYWSLEEETEIVLLLRKVLEHPNAQVVGQNFLYDTQYLYREWRCIPTVVRDTMAAQHAMFAGGPKDLAYLSSMWCDWHLYWKDDSKEWDRSLGEEQLWVYNCTDCVRTYEIDTKQQVAIDSLGLRAVHDWHQAKFWLALDIMLTGLRRDEPTRQQFASLLMDEQESRLSWITEVLGHPINLNSPLQLKKLFYDDLKQRPVLNRKTGAPSTDAEALEVIAKREPGLSLLTRKIAEFRSLGVFLNTFVLARPSWDGRIRTQFNPFGPETYRASSSQDAFGSGMNLQNIPSGNEDDPSSELQLPNIRRLFLPDSGYVIYDIDLDRADLQVVVWEAEDEGLMTALREGLDMHLYNARDIFNLSYTNDEIIDGTETCTEIKKKYKPQRQKAKMGCHATNYGIGEYTLAIALGITRHEAAKFINRWFSAHPGIRRWHERTQHSLQTRRYVENKFGFRRYYLERLDAILPEALAWTPQSTVAEVINRLWWKIALAFPKKEAQVLLQVHDSLVAQVLASVTASFEPRVYQLASEVIVPYDRPLVIPIGMKRSTKSWGDAA